MPEVKLGCLHPKWSSSPEEGNVAKSDVLNALCAAEMQSLAVLLVVAAVFGSVSASLYAPNQCIVFDHIDNDQVRQALT